MPVRMKDIAEGLGVSLMTVSKDLRNGARRRRDNPQAHLAMSQGVELPAEWERAKSGDRKKRPDWLGRP
jgi:hypothetical protein